MTSSDQGADPTADWTPRGIDTQTPSTARMYDYYLGGKHHYPADRETAEQVLAVVPDLPVTARENRKFLQRAVRVMTEAGIRQFLDLGTGLPTQQNVHQVAQAIRPDARVAYVDNDPVALAHARALLANDNHISVADADLREPGQVLNNRRVTELIDFAEPIGVLFVAILHFVTDEENPAGIVASFRDAIPPGSSLALSHAAPENLTTEQTTQARLYDQATSTFTLRTREQIQRLFTGFDLLEPGVVPAQQWRNDPEEAQVSTQTVGLVGLGYKSS